MAGIIVSASIGMMKPLLGKLSSLMREEFAMSKNLRKEVNFISEELTAMKDALEGLADLEELDSQTKRWRDIVREISYDIEDIIDDFMHHIGDKNNTDGFGRKTARLLRKLRARRQIAGQIKEIKKRVLETGARRERYLFPIIPSRDVAIDPRVTTHYENAANIVGMKAKTNELASLLCDEEKQLKVVSIVGFGGLGKTTLANEVQDRLKDDFDCGAFATVSQNTDIPKLIHTLLSGLGSGISFYGCDLSFLQKKLREYLQHKRYLVIIDDLWNVEQWVAIKCAFPENGLGSRVIVTTRIQDVAKECCSHELDHIFEMKPLTKENSRKLFLDRIFGSKEACPRHLRNVSVKIIKKCGGLPLAILSISSMLASEGSNQRKRWEHVASCLASEKYIKIEGMRKILNLSYKHLPSHLKTCLLYLGMYPEDYVIIRDNLESQWMAEGFITEDDGQDVQKVARNYFNELVNRSLIQPVKFDNEGSVSHCRVHDMILDLILVKSAAENFFTIVDDSQTITQLDYKIRRLSIRMESACATMIPRNISISQVRTLMLFGSCSETSSLSKFKFLRVCFSDVRNTAVVSVTGLRKLYHLRYLHMSGNIVCERIGNIKSLQNLIGFDVAENTIDNIKGLGELANLRHLDLICSYTPDDKEKRMEALCSSVARLSSLADLRTEGMGQIDGLFPLSPPPTPYCLQTLQMSRFCWFSRVPTWMGELHKLEELQCEVEDLLNDGVRILAQLPVLTDLELTIRGDLTEMIVFYKKAFPALRRFKLKVSRLYLNFQPHALPKLQKLELMCRDGLVSPTGLHHLLALEEFSVETGDDDGSAMTSAVNVHHSDNPGSSSSSDTPFCCVGTSWSGLRFSDIDGIPPKDLATDGDGLVEDHAINLRRAAATSHRKTIFSSFFYDDPLYH